MPKQVNHEQRRGEIAAALCRLASERGLEGVSLGEVAAEAGISKGLVQHYFRNKDLMLRYATGYLRERIEQRISRQLAETSSEPREVLRAVLIALLPLDQQARAESLVTDAFLFRALRDPAMAERFREGYRQLRTALTGLVEAVDTTGKRNAEREADGLLAMVSGLGEAVLLGYHPAAEAIAVLDHHLDRLGLAPPR